MLTAFAKSLAGLSTELDIQKIQNSKLMTRKTEKVNVPIGKVRVR